MRKDYINHFRSEKPLEGILFTDFIRDVLEKRSRRKSEHYAAVYDAIIKHIDNFSSEFDCDIFTNSVTAEFIDDFIIYLEDQGLRHNTIVGYILKIQTLVRRASQYNYAVDNTYDEIDLRTEPTNAVFLSMNEITRIYYYKFEKQDKRKAKERIRDLFVVGCLTALRYSDYSTLTATNLQNGYIVKRTKKTNVDVKVPAHDYVKEIFAKYNGFVPRGLCIQYFNKYLKVIMKEIGLNDLVICFNFCSLILDKELCDKQFQYTNARHDHRYGRLASNLVFQFCQSEHSVEYPESTVIEVGE